MKATAMSLVSCDVREGNDCSWHPEDQIWVTRWRQPILNGTVTAWTIFFFFFPVEYKCQPSFGLVSLHLILLV